jgi:hypothetical protein
VLLAGDQQVIQALAAQCSDEPFGEGMARGDRTGVFITRVPLPAKTSSKAAVNLLSRSWTRNVKLAGRLPRFMRRKIVSACRKSQARIPAAWEARKCCQVGQTRRGAGPSPAAARIRRIVPSPIR